MVPLSIVMYLLPGVTLLQQGLRLGNADGAVVNPLLNICMEKEDGTVSRVQLWDRLFPPTPEDLATDANVHPYYAHSTRQRWWCHHKDAERTARQDGRPENAFQYRLLVDSAQLVYNMRKSELYVHGVFEVRVKEYKADRDGNDIPWRLLGL